MTLAQMRKVVAPSLAELDDKLQGLLLHHVVGQAGSGPTRSIPVMGAGDSVAAAIPS